MAKRPTTNRFIFLDMLENYYITKSLQLRTQKIRCSSDRAMHQSILELCLAGTFYTILKAEIDSRTNLERSYRSTIWWRIVTISPNICPAPTANISHIRFVRCASLFGVQNAYAGFVRVFFFLLNRHISFGCVWTLRVQYRRYYFCLLVYVCILYGEW